MKITIDLLSLIRLDFGIERGDGGSYFVQKLFLTFLDRPAKPHISIFAGPKDRVIEPHFTAARSSPREFRRTLARIASVRIEQTMECFAEEAVREVAGVLQPVDLEAFEAEGWTIHWVNRRALHRWMRLARRQSTVFHLDAEVMCALTLHVWRHWFRPTVLAGEQPRTMLRFLALRWNEERREPDVRVFLYYPDGVPSIDSAGNAFLSDRAGWYSYPFEVPFDEMITRMMPAGAVQKVAGNVESYLERYPRRGHASSAEAFDGVPLYASGFLGFYASWLFEAAIAAVAEAQDPAPLRAA